MTKLIPAKKHFSLGTAYVDLITRMAEAEDRPMARVLRQALKEYAIAHHKTLAVAYILPSEGARIRL